MFGKIKCMFTRKKKRNKLDELIDLVEDQLLVMDVMSKDYKAVLNHLDQLHKLKTQKRGWKVKPDTMVQVAGSLGGILLILGFEKANVLTSKAVGFILRGRV